MTRNEKSLQALFSSNESGWCFVFGTDKASVFEKNGRYMVEYSYGNQVSDHEYFDDEETAKEYAIDLSQSRRPIKSGVRTEMWNEGDKDGVLGTTNTYYTSEEFRIEEPELYEEYKKGFEHGKRERSWRGRKTIHDDIFDIELNNSRKPIKSTRVSDLSETERDRLYEIEKHEAEEYYNSLSDSDKQMLRLRYGIKNARDYVKFFVVHPNRLSEDYEYMIDPKEKLQSSRRPIKSDVIIKFEYKDKKYGNPNVKYTQTAIYPSVNEFKKIMDENNTEFKIIRVTPLK